MARNKNTQTTLGYKELKAELRAGQNRRLYVLYGEEDFLIEKLVDSISELLVDASSMALDRVVLDGRSQASRISLEQLTAEVMTPPFLSRCKVVIVRQSGWFAPTVSRITNDAETSEPSAEEEEDSPADRNARKGLQDNLAELVARLPDSVCLCFVETKVDRRLKQLVNQIEQAGVLAEIGREHPKTLQQWVDAECRRRGIQIAPEAAESLIDRCDLSMQVIWQELNKLFLYCAGAKCLTVGLPLIAEISLPDMRGNIFNLTDALSDGQTEKALQLVDTLISQRQPVQLIQFMLARHFRQLICAAELGRPDRIAAELKVLPFVASRLANQARRFAMPVLEDIYKRCFEADMLVKTGQLGDRLALETLLVTASEAARPAGRQPH